MTKDLAVFEGHEIRRIYDETTETWWFSVVDIIRVLTQQPDYKLAQNYWKVLKHRLKKEGSEVVTKCNQLKMPAADGKSYLTDAATAETLLRLVQSVPSPKAEPIKLWLAKVGYERMQEMADPARSLERARKTWKTRKRLSKCLNRGLGAIHREQSVCINRDFENGRSRIHWTLCCGLLAATAAKNCEQCQSGEEMSECLHGDGWANAQSPVPRRRGDAMIATAMARSHSL